MVVIASRSLPEPTIVSSRCGRQPQADLPLEQRSALRHESSSVELGHTLRLAAGSGHNQRSRRYCETAARPWRSNSRCEWEPDPARRQARASLHRAKQPRRPWDERIAERDHRSGPGADERYLDEALLPFHRCLRLLQLLASNRADDGWLLQSERSEVAALGRREPSSLSSGTADSEWQPRPEPCPELGSSDLRQLH